MSGEARRKAGGVGEPNTIEIKVCFAGCAFLRLFFGAYQRTPGVWGRQRPGKARDMGKAPFLVCRTRETQPKSETSPVPKLNPKLPPKITPNFML